MRIFERIFGRNETSSIYLVRVRLTPRTPWGQLYLHIFHRGDDDQYPHDHPWPFWTFPLTTYEERVWFPDGLVARRTVKRLRWHYRPATHTHMVLDPAPGKKLVTFVWHGVKEREWGFLTYERGWVHWREYLYGEKT